MAWKKVVKVAKKAAKGAKKEVKRAEKEVEIQIKKWQSGSKYEDMTDAELREYKPKVYQKDIFDIDYDRLWENGIRYISFDLDDTIIPRYANKVNEKESNHISGLKEKGFEIVILSNCHKKERVDRVEDIAKKLSVKCVTEAEKPRQKGFQELINTYHWEKDKMAHVGNILSEDILGGNRFGIVTCLIRRNGDKVDEDPKRRAEEQLIADALESRGIWRRHHKHTENDQYYQLGEEPGYKNKSVIHNG